MQVNGIQSNNTSFGAKLVINDSEGILKGVKRATRHGLDKVRAFSEKELKQIETGFAQRTKNLTGEMELKTTYFDFKDYFAPYSMECTHLTYAQNKLNKKSVLAGDEVAGIKLLDNNMPKSVEEFVDRLVGAFTALKNRHAQTIEINRLKNNIEALKTNRTKDTLSEMSKYFELKNPDCY